MPGSRGFLPPNARMHRMPGAKVETPDEGIQFQGPLIAADDCTSPELGL